MKLYTNHPIALDSNDHLFAHGAKNDNTRCPAFVKACERIMFMQDCGRLYNNGAPVYGESAPLRRMLRVLDLGCAGGGLVEDFLEAGHDAYGIDGAEAAKREAWLRHPERFFQADLEHVLALADDPNKLTWATFDIITAFEVMEHLTEIGLIAMMIAAERHLRRDGLFIATISLVPDEVNGVQYHQTVRPADWWRGVLEGNGFTLLDDPFTEEEWPRKEKTSLRVVARRAA